MMAVAEKGEERPSFPRPMPGSAISWPAQSPFPLLFDPPVAPRRRGLAAPRRPASHGGPAGPGRPGRRGPRAGGASGVGPGHGAKEIRLLHENDIQLFKVSLGTLNSARADLSLAFMFVPTNRGFQVAYGEQNERT